MNIKTAIIADDFTGAGDSSIHFCHTGYSVFLPMTLPNTVLPEDLEILAINTESRLDDGTTAYKKTVAAIKKCQSWGTKFFYKKIDSTMRGNIAEEVQAIIDAGHYTASLICPAAPNIGRTVVKGKCLLHGVPIDQTETGKDPLSPVKSSYIKDLFSSLPDKQIAHISTQETEQGPEFLNNLVQTYMTNGITHIICDAENSAHLNVIATLISNTRLLLTGAAGLAAAIAKNAAKRNHNQKNVKFEAGNILLSSGSRMEISRDQIAQLEAKYDCIKILIPTEALATNDVQAISHFWKKVKNIKPGQKSCYILTPDSPKDPSGSSNSRDNSEKIATLIAEVTSYMCQALNISVLLSIGGHTTYKLVKELQATGVSYEGEVLPGTPFGRLQMTVPPQKLSLITKSGSFGDDQTLIQIYDFISKHM